MLSMFKAIIPTKKQFKKWSMPGKVTYISFIIGIISLILGIIPYIITTNNVDREELVKQLETSDGANDLRTLEATLQKVKDNSSLQDVYLYYKGRLAMKSAEIPKDNPGKYLLQIDTGSDYYIRAQKGLAWYYSTVYSGEEYENKLKEITNKIESNNMIDPFYFFLKYMVTNKTYSNIEKEYNRFVNYYKDTYNFNESYFIEPKNVPYRTYYILPMKEIQSLNFFFNSVLLEFAEKENLTTEKIQAFARLKKIEKNTDYILLDEGFTLLNINYKDKEQLKNELIDLKLNTTYDEFVGEKVSTGQVPITIYSAELKK
ncbi:hypothetical protein FE784_40160 [Paenibacillus hemerocallicola]|uniref:Uncharacterized protein n=1 Tax=Paenibacillus hemerocallicola TaxID=1172614 RepID=A0A5C4SUV3_9BACL|nr:hypothetical protein [Paenibacillus hemerocallicola]TNJ53971.1 hypothetical protein FE784_40160 [Paenibacillus hemerocallicola]